MVYEGESNVRKSGFLIQENWLIDAKKMVDEQIRSRGGVDQRVLDIMEKVPRHLFCDSSYQEQAYGDYPLSIGNGQTISQPYIVALMTEYLKLNGDEVVLEIGVGSGYQSAVLSALVRQVYSIECIEILADTAADRLKNLEYNNITIKCGNGYLGWPEYSPFDRIIVTAAPDQVPKALIDQLKIGGVMVIPVGSDSQELFVMVKKNQDEIEQRSIIPVRFVPMVRE